jgi:hypothetical protein
LNASGSSGCAVVEEAAGQNGGRASEPDLPGDGVGGALGLHGLEQVAAEDRLMLAAMRFTPIGDLADIEPVLEQMGKRSDAKADPSNVFLETSIPSTASVILRLSLRILAATAPHRSIWNTPAEQL